MPAPAQSDSMDVFEVRRRLNEMRRLWRESDPKTPFRSSAFLGTTQLTASQFSFQFVQAHHRQRDPKTRNAVA